MCSPLALLCAVSLSLTWCFAPLWCALLSCHGCVLCSAATLCAVFVFFCCGLFRPSLWCGVCVFVFFRMPVRACWLFAAAPCRVGLLVSVLLLCGGVFFAVSRCTVL